MQTKAGQALRDGRADQVVSELFALSRAQAARAIAEGRVLLNGSAISKSSMPLSAGADLILQLPQATEAEAKKQDIPITLLYEDAKLAVAVKPYGMVVHPAPGHEDGTLVNALLYALDGLSGIGGVKRPGIVHRLDKDTSGLLLVAKTDAAHLALSSQLKARSMEKHYLAVVCGEMKDIGGSIDKPIARSKKDRKKMAIDPEGREAMTEWTLIENLRDAALLDVRILTGRTHQIRIHMQSIHHPVAGDPIYGLKGGVSVPRLMLHAFSLAFDHPVTGERMRFTAPPPEAFVSAIQKLRIQKSTPLPDCLVQI